LSKKNVRGFALQVQNPGGISFSKMLAQKRRVLGGAARASGARAPDDDGGGWCRGEGAISGCHFGVRFLWGIFSERQEGISRTGMREAHARNGIQDRVQKMSDKKSDGLANGKIAFGVRFGGRQKGCLAAGKSGVKWVWAYPKTGVFCLTFL